MSSEPDPSQPGLTIRSFIIAVVALFAMGFWIEYEEVFSAGGPLGENAPPNSAVGVIMILLMISAVLYRVREALRLTSGELVVVYSALLVAAPLMTQGMWHRLPGLLAGIAHNQDFKSYESLPSMLWPHGENLVSNHRFENGLGEFESSGGPEVRFEVIDRGEKGQWNSPVLSGDGDPANASALSYSIPRYAPDGTEQLVPGESYMFTVLVKADGFTKGSLYYAKMRADEGQDVSLVGGTSSTRPTFANPGGFQRVGVNPISIPRDLDERLTLTLGIVGSGTLAVQDVEFFNNEAVEALYSGVKVVRESNLERLDGNDRDSTRVRPDRRAGLRGFGYLLKGYIPIEQWVRPVLSWLALISAMFMGLYGASILMRKQWVENERLTMPQTIIAKQLFGEVTDEAGRVSSPIFRNRTMWLGFALAFGLALLKGFHFYNPNIPAPVFAPMGFDSYVEAQWLKALFKDVGIGLSIGAGISLVVLAIALLVETDILFSLWTMFLLFRLWHVFGYTANLSSIPGYPWAHQQNMGGFIAYGLLAVWAGRQHLTRAIKLTLGGPALNDEEERQRLSYRWAFVMIVAAVAGVAWWSAWTRMGVLAGLLFFGYLMLCGFTLSKIRAECGAPFGYATPYFGMQFIAVVGGMTVFKTTGVLVATMASGFMCVAVFLMMAPVQVEMMEVARHFRVRSVDLGAGLWLGLLGGVLIGGFVVLCWAYAEGANNTEYTWPFNQNWYFNQYRGLEKGVDRAFEAGTLGTAPETQALNIFKNPDAKGLGIGALATFLLAFLRARFAWFPFHPIGYILAPTYFMMGLWFVLFLAWLIRSILLRIGGARMIRYGLVPFSVGILLGAVVSIFFFDGVGLYLRAQGATKIYAGIP
ncbi:MAG: hypothetical protein O2901_06375 [Verrucomicrobia bacterium]|nr:hypothetical protein [Verrucomicrobiota bacterium]